MRIWKHLGATAAALLAAGLAAPASAAPAPPDFPTAKLGEVVGNATNVVFGEDSHGMAAVHAVVPPMFEYLVEHKGFRAFVFEVQWNVTDAFRDFMASDRTTLNTMEQFYLDGAFVSDSTAGMLVWIRNWNRAHPHDPIGIYGYQPEQAVTDSRALVAFLNRYGGRRGGALAEQLGACKATDPALKTDLDMVIANGKLAKAGKVSFTDAERTTCFDAIARAETAIAAARTAPRRERVLARLHAISLKAYIGIIRKLLDQFTVNPNLDMAGQLAAQHEIYHNGDATRFRILQALRAEFFPGKKAFFWMHDWHAARHASELGPLPGEAGIPPGTVSIGERITAAAPRTTVTIGNLVPCGTTCKEPAGSLEPAFAQKYDGHIALVDLRDPRDTVELPVRTTGTFYANQNKFGFSNVVLARQFDAILYIPKTDPVH